MKIIDVYLVNNMLLLSLSEKQPLSKEPIVLINGTKYAFKYTYNERTILVNADPDVNFLGAEVEFPMKI